MMVLTSPWKAIVIIIALSAMVSNYGAVESAAGMTLFIVGILLYRLWVRRPIV